MFSCLEDILGDIGLELNSQKTSQPSKNEEVKAPPCHTHEHKAVHDPVHHSVFCSELQQIIDRWDSLPEYIKAAIKALIQTHNTEVK